MIRVDPELLPDDVRTAIEDSRVATGGAVNLFLVLAANPGLFRKYVPFGGRLLLRSAFDPRDRELVIIRTAWRCDCRYELQHHLRIGADVGLTSEEIAATVGDADTVLSERQETLLRAVDDLVDRHRVESSRWERLGRELTDAQRVELPLLVGNYMMIAGLANSMDLPLDDDGTSTQRVE